jgi:tRNA threonylcarbamoyl adenosine modification protein YeaZ
MIILAADTSLPLLSVAILRDDDLVAAAALEGKGSRNEKLLPAIDWLLAESGVDRQYVDLFAVTRGPGSFTGVRIGLATIQGLALALGKPVCAMSTHQAIAPASGRVTVVDDAGRGEFYVSAFEDGREVAAPHLAKSASGLTVAEFLRTGNAAAACARRARAIAQAGELACYADATPIYVRLAEAEEKLKRGG